MLLEGLVLASAGGVKTHPCKCEVQWAFQLALFILFKLLQHPCKVRPKGRPRYPKLLCLSFPIPL